MSAGNNGRTGGPSGPSVYLRTRELTSEELTEVPPVKTRPVAFTGRGLGNWGKWRPGDPVGEQTEPSKDAERALLDWAVVSWVRRRVVEEVVDRTADVDDADLPSDAEVCAIAREAGLEVVD